MSATLSLITSYSHAIAQPKASPLATSPYKQPNWTLVATNSITAGMGGGFAVSPFLFYRKILKDLPDQFYPQSPHLNRVKYAVLGQPGLHWEIYKDLQAKKVGQGALLGIAMASIKWLYHRFKLKPLE